MVRSIRLSNSVLDAAKANDVENFEAVASDITAEELASFRDLNGNTVLHLWAGHRSVLGLTTALRMLGSSASTVINETNAFRKTALHIAAATDSVEGIRLLTGAGADLNVANHAGSTPLLSAASCGSVDACHLLLDLGAAAEQAEKELMSAGSFNGRVVEQETEVDATPLHAAVAAGHVRVVSLLLERGVVPVDAVAGEHTPLHVAAAHGHMGIVAALIDAAAGVNATTTTTNETPLHLALQHGHWLTADALIAAGADPMLTTSMGSTALHVAAANLRDEGFCAGYETVRTLVLVGREPLLMKRDRLGRRAHELAPRSHGTLFLLSAVVGDKEVADADAKCAADYECAVAAAVRQRVNEKAAAEAEAERVRNDEADRVKAREMGQWKIFVAQQQAAEAEAAAAKAEAARIAAARKKKKKAAKKR